MLKKNYQICLFVVLCILINFGFKFLTSVINLPLWLDSIGTAFAAYMLGPACGAIVGATVNIAYGFIDPVAVLYSITNIAVGILIGLYARKKKFEKIFDMLTASTTVTLVATVISSFINWIMYGGSTGNLWGDGILNMLLEWRIPMAVSVFAAEFFLEFVDKFLTLLILFISLHVFRFFRKKRISLMEKIGKNLEQTPNLNKEMTQNMNMVKGLIILFLAGILFLTAGNTAYASGKIDYSTYIQTLYGNEEGLTSGEANDIASTNDGVLWIGTYAGLYRYSGNDFKYMKEFESVKNVNCLYIDEEGRLWIGTNDDGVSICINETITEVFDKSTGFSSNSIRSITQSSDGYYYIGTSDELIVVSLVGGSNIVKSYPDIVYASDLSADNAGHVAAITLSGKIYVLNIEGVLDCQAIDGEAFTSCEFTQSGDLIVSTEKGNLYRYVLDGDKLVLKEDYDTSDKFTYINALEEIESGDIFICGDNTAGWLDKSREVHVINMGSFSNIDRMIQDYQGGLWFCSSRLGLMKMTKSTFKELYSEADIPEKVVNAITEWNGCLYFGTDNGLDIVKKDSLNKVENSLTDLLEGSRIRCFMVDTNNQLWICDYSNGIICVSEDGGETFFNSQNGAIGNKFRSIIELSDKQIVASSERGITFIKDGSVTQTIGAEDGLNNELVLCLLETNDNTLLAGTDGGGIAVIKDGLVTKNYTRNDGLGSEVILRMIPEAGTNNIFVVTSNGISYLTEEGTIRELDNFPYSNNYDIYDPGKGKLYVTSSAGIYIVDKEELLEGKEDLNYENLNYQNGLRGSFTANAWNYVDQKGNWYIAGGTGVTLYEISNHRNKINSYRIRINSITTDDEVHYLNNENSCTVERGVSYIKLEPEIINYSSEDPYVCYYLEGKEKDKKIVRQSELDSVIYSNLSAGTYKFHLAILTSATGEAIEEVVFTIVKEAEIYDHFWFKVYFFVELMFIVAWFTWYITKRTALRALALQKKELALAKEQIRMGNETILAIARTVDAKDSYTSDHSTRVAQYSAMIAKRMGYAEEAIENLKKVALLHDIGKIGIPDSVLNKPGKLTEEEYAIMKSHVTRGAEILKDFTLIPKVVEGVKYHHERYDGTGYSEGLKGKEIPEIARIICIADSFDAMSKNRIYRKHLSFDVVIDELKKGRGTQFDPDIVDIFLKIIEDGEITAEGINGEEVE